VGVGVITVVVRVVDSAITTTILKAIRMDGTIDRTWLWSISSSGVTTQARLGIRGDPGGAVRTLSTKIPTITVRRDPQLTVMLVNVKIAVDGVTQHSCRHAVYPVPAALGLG
jgi:hypothetical protein